MTQTRAITLNVLSLYAVALVLVAAFAAQFILHELPCPLCLLQRILFAALAVGPILNIRFGPAPATMRCRCWRRSQARCRQSPEPETGPRLRERGSSPVSSR